MESKEYLEINFKFNYDGEDESPVKLDLGIVGKDSTASQDQQNNRKSTGNKFDIYEKDTMIFIEPMFMIDTKKF